MSGWEGRLDEAQLAAVRDGVDRIADQHPAPPRVQPKASNPAAPVTAAQLCSFQEGVKKAIAITIARERSAAAMRFTELERRCADLEARLAALESRGGAE